jgi:hypothetical protein
VKVLSWRTAAITLAVVCCYQRWHSCTHSSSSTKKPVTSADRSEPSASTETPSLPSAITDPPKLDTPAAATNGKSFYGFKIPAWAARLAPQPGESMRDYRDRVLPLAQLAVAPQRARVARTRDDFGTLDAHQLAELDGAVQEAATAIENRVLQAVATGELRPATFKPMTGVTMARDVLDIVDRGNTRFMTSLTPEQRTKLATHRFDFADYLLFSTRWEDALR